MKNTKRFISVLLCLIMLFGTVSVGGEGGIFDAVKGLSAKASAANYTGSSEYYYGDDYRYTIKEDGTIALDSYMGSNAKVTIPTKIDGKTVTQIDNYVFYDGRRSDAVEVTKIFIPECIIEIYNAALNGCSRLEEIIVDEYNPYFKSIDGNLFSKDGTYFLQYCAANPRTSYTFPSTVKYIMGWGAFEYANNLTYVYIPDSVEYIDNYTFCDCTNLKNVRLPSLLYKINDGVFQECISLSEISLPVSLTYIDSAAFRWSGLKKVFIPKNVRTIVYSAFNYCNQLTEFSVDPENDYFSAVDGVLFDKQITKMLYYPLASDRTEYTVPSTVREIADGACDVWDADTIQLPKLKKLILPENLKIIGRDAFVCENVEEIIIGNNLQKIGYDGLCFPKHQSDNYNWENDVYYIGNAAIYADDWRNRDIKTVFIRSGTYIIADSAFWAEDFINVVVPITVNFIGSGCFYACDELEKVVMLNKNCNIADDEGTISKDAEIYGYTGSTAQTYAAKYERTFVPLENYDCSNNNHLYLTCKSVQATCSESGYNECKCAICGKEYTENVKKLPHAFENGFCKVCKEKDPDFVFPAISIGETKKVTITSKGQTVYYEFKPDMDISCSLSSAGDYDTYAVLCDESLNILTSNDDGVDSNFNIQYSFERGEVYYFGCRFFSANETGEFDITLKEIHIHKYDDPEIIKPATIISTGVVRYICISCGEEKIEVIPMLDALPSERKVEIEKNNSLSDDEDDSTVFFDENADLPENTVFEVEILELTDWYETFDLNLKSDEENIEPKSPVWVKMPIPKSWVPANPPEWEQDEITVWHGFEKLVSFIEGNYIWFYTSHFSKFEIHYEGEVEPLNPTANAKLSVKSDEVYKNSKVTVVATASDVPEGYYIAIFDGSKEVQRGDNKTVSYYAGEIASDKTLTAKTVDTDGNVQKDANGSELSQKIEIKVKTGFFNMIIAFFKKLIRSNEVTIKP